MLPAALIAGPVFGLVAVAFMVAIRNSLRFAAGGGWSVLRLAMAAVVQALPAFVQRRWVSAAVRAAILGGGYGTMFLAVLLAAVSSRRSA